MPSPRALALLAIPLALSGCLTISGGQLAEVPVEPGAAQPEIHHTIGDFRFELDGGKSATSDQIGQMMNEKLLDRWVDSRLISQHQFVQSSEFSDAHPLRLTLSGRRHGEANAVIQFLSYLTLLAIPHVVDSEMTVRFTLESRESGCLFEATASESYQTVLGLLLIPILPFSQIGANRSYARIADHLYSQLSAAGAFDDHAPCEAAPLVLSAEARSRELEGQLALGLLSESEYEARLAEPYFVTGEPADPACSLSLVSSDDQSEARFEFRASKVGMVPGVLRCASTAATLSIDREDIEVCVDGDLHPTLPVEEAIERARAPVGLPLGLVGGFQAGLAEARNDHLEAAFRAGRYGPAELGPGQQASGLVFFDAPASALAASSGAMIRVYDLDWGDTRLLTLGDTSSCSGE